MNKYQHFRSIMFIFLGTLIILSLFPNILQPMARVMVFIFSASVMINLFFICFVRLMEWFNQEDEDKK